MLEANEIYNVHNEFFLGFCDGCIAIHHFIVFYDFNIHTLIPLFRGYDDSENKKKTTNNNNDNCYMYTPDDANVHFFFGHKNNHQPNLTEL